MRRLILSLLLVTLLISPVFNQPAAAQANPPAWASLGPYDIQWLQTAPSNPQMLFALSKGLTLCALLRSSDAGLHWSLVTDSLACNTGLAVDSTNPNVLYIYTADQVQSVQRSPDGGQSWLPFATPVGLPIGKLQINPGNPQYMYIGSYSSGNFISTDGGQIWTETDCYIYACEYLVFSPENPQIVYGLGWNSDLYKSTNGGVNWTNKNTTAYSTYAHCRGPLINPYTPAELYIRCDYGKVYLSSTAGDSWAETTLYDPYGFDPSDSQVFYRLLNNQVYRTDDHATSWKLITGTFPSGNYEHSLNPELPPTLWIDPVTQGRLYCTTALGLAVSSDWGDHWQLLSLGYSRGMVLSLAVARGQDAPIYATTGTLSGYSTAMSLVGNRSGNWNNINLSTTGYFAADPQLSQTVYLTANGLGIYKSTNGGTDWVLKNSGMSNMIFQTVAVSNFTSQTVFAGAWYNGQLSELGGFYKSTNGGDTWQIYRSGIDNPNIYVIAQHPTDPNILYVGVKAAAFRVYKSLNGGQTWNSAAGGLPNADIRALQVDPFHPETVYAATYGSGVYKTSNGGASWAAVNTGLTDSPNYTYALALDPTTPDTLYVGTSSSVFYSLNGGASWAKLGASLSGVLSLAFDPDNPHTLYAGSGLSGVYVMHIPYTRYLPRIAR